MSDYDRSTGWFGGFHGVIAAAVTPFDDAGGVAFDRIPPLVQLLVDGGAGGIMVGGTTGEFVALTPAERSDVLRAFLDAVAGRVPVVAHVGASDPGTAQRLTADAAAAGAQVVAAMTPQFFPTTEPAVERYFRELARAVPHLPFLVYDFPSRAGNTVSTELFTRLLEEPNLAGTKMSIETLGELVPFLAFEPEVVVICGNDTLQERFVAEGGRAVVSGNATLYPELVSRIFARLLDGAAAPEDLALLADVAAVTRAGAPDRLKALLRRRGHDAGASRVRTHLDTDVDEPDAAPRLDRIEAALRADAAAAPRADAAAAPPAP